MVTVALSQQHEVNWNADRGLTCNPLNWLRWWTTSYLQRWSQIRNTNNKQPPRPHGTALFTNANCLFTKRMCVVEKFVLFSDSSCHGCVVYNIVSLRLSIQKKLSSYISLTTYRINSKAKQNKDSGQGSIERNITDINKIKWRANWNLERSKKHYILQGLGFKRWLTYQGSSLLYI